MELSIIYPASLKGRHYIRFDIPYIESKHNVRTEFSKDSDHVIFFYYSLDDIKKCISYNIPYSLVRSSGIPFHRNLRTLLYSFKERFLNKNNWYIRYHAKNIFSVLPEKGVIRCPSSDYTFWLKRNSVKYHGNVVFLDQFIGNDPEEYNAGLFINKKKYHLEVEKYLSQFDDIIIARHPRNTDKTFHNYQMSDKTTIDLILGASEVIGHFSTAISFAVLAKKPITILTTSELTKSYLYSYMQGFSDELGINIVKPHDIHSTPNINCTAYDNFIEKYIVPKGRENQTIGEVICQYL